MTFKVLVLDAAQRSALAVTRALGKLEQVRVFTAEASAQALAGTSKYSHVFFQSPSSHHNPQAFIEWIKQLQEAENFALILPVTEITSQLLLMNQLQLPQVKLPFAAYDQVMRLADKGQLVELARQLEIPVPPSNWYANAQGIDPQNLQYPVVIKPCLSKIFVAGGWLATRVKVVQTPQEFAAEISASPYLLQHPFMVQGFVPGHGAGIFALYHHGQAVVFFAHQRLREKPPEGGISVLSASVAADPIAEDYARKLLDAAGWHGVAMVEFRVGPDGTYYLMEVNTRFWGSLQLSIDAGVNFPKLLFQSALGLPLDNLKPYQIGQRLRWLLGDFDSLYLYLRGRYSLTQKMRRVMQFMLPSFSSCRHEINRLEDLAPAFYEIKLYVRQLLGKA